jgi:hypothetical protein
MKGPQILLENEDRLVTKMGGWFPGERVVMRGQDLHVDLVGKMDWMELLTYAITGRRFTPAQMKVLNAVWTVISFPEPRVWCNRVTALGGTARSTGALSIAAGIATADASIYGQRPIIRAMDFLLRTQRALEQGSELQEWLKLEIKKYHLIYGYGRPVATKDERIPHLMRVAREVGLDQGRYVVLVFEIERLLMKDKKNLRMNIGGLYGAFAADFGFSSQEWGLFTVACFLAGMPPCFSEADTKPEGSFFPLRCKRIAYDGAPRRAWGSQ